MKKPIVQKISLVCSDILSLAFSLLLAKFILNLIRPGIDTINLDSFGIAKAFGLVIIGVFWYQEHYIKRRPIWEELRLVYKTIFIFAFLHLGVSYLVAHHVIKLLSVVFWLSLLLVLPLFRILTKLVLMHFNQWQRDVYIVGSGDNAFECAKVLMSTKLLGYNLVSFMALGIKHQYSITIGKISYPIQNYQMLFSGEYDDAEVVLALSSQEIIEHANLINRLQSKFVFVSIVPDVTGLPMYGVSLEHFFGSEQLFLRLHNSLGRRINRILKRTTDIIVSLLMIIILSPILLVIALMILFSGNSVFFSHKRIGRGGRIFGCIKFQTMYANADELLQKLLDSDKNARLEWERDFKLKDDPRVTPMGKFLRKTSLDELPQLFNVLKGEMSLVGPRPIVKAEVERYYDDYYYYQLVRPGITGLWQISGRNDVDYTQRVRLDVWYVKNWALWYDFVILFKTVLVVLTRDGAY